MTRITDTLHEGHYTFMIIYRSVLLRMRNVLDETVEKTGIHRLFKIPT